MGVDMKAICIIASDNVVVDGDVVFNPEDSGFDTVLYSSHKNLKITRRGFMCVRSFKGCDSLKLKFLWFWHMVILRKSHVYLTGLLK